MPNDNRLNLDDQGDLNFNGNDLLTDVMKATEQAKKRKADDKAKEQEITQKKQDRTIIYALVGAAAVVLLLVSYLMVFRGNQNVQTVAPPKSPAGFSLPAPGTKPGARQPAYAAQPNRPPVAAPANRPPATSEPVQRNGSDTYDEGSGPGGSQM